MKPETAEIIEFLRRAEEQIQNDHGDVKVRGSECRRDLAKKLKLRYRFIGRKGFIPMIRTVRGAADY
jgi:hypothetical protein